MSETGMALKGQIIDEDGTPHANVMIRVTHQSLQGFQGAATWPDGHWMIPFLPQGINFVVEALDPEWGYARALANVVPTIETVVEFNDWQPLIKEFPPLDERPEEPVYVYPEFCPYCGKKLPEPKTLGELEQ